MAVVVAVAAVMAVAVAGLQWLAVVAPQYGFYLSRESALLRPKLFVFWVSLQEHLLFLAFYLWGLLVLRVSRFAIPLGLDLCSYSSGHLHSLQL